ncbi:MAG: ankyrin repeat domain-containing protein, partial [Rickettsiaceae bacterium]|nr:ankyrin repeat domain-containing protein [Rickettsiaceae bacterium]
MPNTLSQTQRTKYQKQREKKNQKSYEANSDETLTSDDFSDSDSDIHSQISLLDLNEIETDTSSTNENYSKNSLPWRTNSDIYDYRNNSDSNPPRDEEEAEKSQTRHKDQTPKNESKSHYNVDTGQNPHTKSSSRKDYANKDYAELIADNIKNNKKYEQIHNQVIFNALSPILGESRAIYVAEKAHNEQPTSYTPDDEQLITKAAQDVYESLNLAVKDNSDNKPLESGNEFNVTIKSNSNNATLPTKIRNDKNGIVTLAITFACDKAGITNMPQKDAKYIIAKYGKDGKLIDLILPPEMDTQTGELKVGKKTYHSNVTPKNIQELQDQLDHNQAEYSAARDSAKRSGNEELQKMAKTLPERLGSYKPSNIPMTEFVDMCYGTGQWKSNATGSGYPTDTDADTNTKKLPFEIARNGTFKEMMKNMRDIHKADELGNTILHHAAICGNAETASAILTISPKMANTINNDGNTPLHLGAAFGNAKICNTLLSNNSDALYNNDGLTPLHMAIIHNKIDTLDALLTTNRGTNYIANIKTQDGRTPLFLALQAENKKMVEVLLERGANLDDAAMNLATRCNNKDIRTLVKTAKKQQEEARVSTPQEQSQTQEVNKKKTRINLSKSNNTTQPKTTPKNYQTLLTSEENKYTETFFQGLEHLTTRPTTAHSSPPVNTPNRKSLVRHVYKNPNA